MQYCELREIKGRNTNWKTAMRDAVWQKKKKAPRTRRKCCKSASWQRTSLEHDISKVGIPRPKDFLEEWGVWEVHRAKNTNGDQIISVQN